ncbi:hypothetical protein H920_12803 [Fukomys damarensis]|uniref:Uncharacterized protein n=1 Tax=Fukomys damarensis TaxID=885580 RepID=A0A091D6J1_FUKDA|nr:hypothetical protein H920_12803 [Fukomys damarensis]
MGRGKYANQDQSCQGWIVAYFRQQPDNEKMTRLRQVTTAEQEGRQGPEALGALDFCCACLSLGVYSRPEMNLIATLDTCAAGLWPIAENEKIPRQKVPCVTAKGLMKWIADTGTESQSHHCFLAEQYDQFPVTQEPPNLSL